MVMGSLFSDFVGDANPDKEEDQPQQPPPQDPLAQQPTQDQIDSLNHAQGVVQQGLQTVTNMFGPQAQQTADQNSIGQAQGLVNNAFQGIQTVGNAVDQDQASANQRLAQVTGGMGQDPLSRGLAQVGPGMNWAQNNIINNIPVPGMAGEGLNLASAGLNALGVNAPNLGSVGGVMQAANLPAEQLPNIPGFSSQPQIAQQFERGAVGAAPYVLGGPESAVGKGLSILGGGLGSLADQNLGTQLGPLGFGQLLGMGAGGLADRGIRNADPLGGIQSPQGVPGATGLGNDLNTPKSDWLQQLNTAPRDRFTGLNPDKSQVPAYQENIASVTDAQTGRPMDFNGLRQEGTEPRRAGTGTFYGIDPNTTNLYALDRGTGEGFDSKVGGATGGAENSLTVERVHLDNPLVIEGGHHQLAQVGPQVFAESPAKDALLDFWQQGIPTNPREAWYVKSDQLIADAAKTSGYDGIVYRRPTEDLWDMPNWGKNVASPKSLSELGNSAVNDTEIVKFDQTPTTSTTAPTSTTTTSGAQPNEPEFRSDFNIQPEQLSGLAKSIADHQKVISDMAVNAGITEDQARQMLANADMSSIRTRGASAREDYEETIGNLMRQDGLTREQAERVYMRPASFENGTNGPTSITTTSGGMSPEEEKAYRAGYDLASVPGSNYGRPQYGWPNVGNGAEDNPLSNAHWAGVAAAQAERAAAASGLNQAGQINAGMDTRTPEQIAASNAAGSDAFGNLRSASPGAQAFQQSPAGQQFNGQRATGVQAGEASAPINNNGGRGGYGGNGPPPTLVGKIDWDPFHNLMSAIGAPTQPLLTGLHLARFAPQEALRPSVLGNGLRAMGEAALKGNADAVSAHINNDFGPNVPAGVRPEAMKQWSGNPSTNPTAVQKFINSLPVVGPVLNRFREVNSALLGNLRDAHYLTAADRLARTDPNASLDMYNDLWREANNATGHSTIPGLSGNSVIGNMGLGPSAMAARVQELGNTVIGSGAPVPFAAAGSRAEAFKTLMGVAGTMAGTTALASALGANVNTTNPFTAFGVDSTFLKPVTTNGVFKTAYGTGGAGYDTVIKAAANIGNDLFNGDEKAALNHALAFSRGEFGVVPSGVIDAILGTTWDGKPYSWNDFLNEAKTGFMADQNGNLGQGRSVPIPAQDMGEAFRAYGPEGLLRAAPSLLASSVQTSPINTTSQAFKYATTPETLTRAFQGEDKPLATILQGKDWNDLMSTEKSALTKTLDPQVLQQIHDESYQRNPETTKHSDTVQYIAEKKLATENATLDRYNRKEITADQAASQMKAAQKEYFAVKNQLDSMPGYLAEQKKFDKSNESGAQIALDGFYQIQDKAGRAAYVAAIMQHDPELGARLLLATQPRNQSKLEELYYSGQLK